MLRRFFQSRGMRKFRRDRMAVAGSVVIFGYFLIAVGVGLFGLVSVNDTKERVMPNRYPGFLEEPTMEKHFGFARWWWRDHFEPVLVERAHLLTSQEELRRIAAEELDLAERTLVDLPVQEVLALAVEAQEAWDALRTTWVLREETADEIVAIGLIAAKREGGMDDAMRTTKAEFEVDLARLDGESRAALGVALGKFEALQPIPPGFAGLKYKWRTCLGSDSKGSSIMAQAVYSIKIAFLIGLVTAIVSVFVGSLLGAAAGFFGGWADAIIMWLVSTLSSIPYLVLLTVVAYAFTGSRFDDPESPGKALIPVYVAFCSVFWIGTCRVVRGEVLKIKELEYVQAATAVGFSRFYILVRHVIPNTSHLLFINFSLLFIGAIKSEVILSFLGLGVKGQSSWGIMINFGRDGVTSFYFWEVGVATVFMFVLVLAFNLVSDALQDAFDPKHVG
ncbi:MAG: ABC-type dipeptide/oligopeptide/nickel transport system permease subunit [Planctomycetota bacterium]|jgi:ABC-type dipeptide/oligopeptide/nickel transport system permease subunit